MFADLRSGNCAFSEDAMRSAGSLDQCTHSRHVVNVRAHDSECRDDVVNPCCLLKLGQNKQCKQESADNVHSDCAFIASNLVVLHSVFACILNDGIKALESLDALAECLDIFVILEVKVPDFDDAFPATCLFNILGRCFTFGGGARCDDHALSIQLDEVASSFLSETCICASYNDGSASTISGRVFGCSKDLLVENLA